MPPILRGKYLKVHLHAQNQLSLGHLDSMIVAGFVAADETIKNKTYFVSFVSCRTNFSLPQTKCKLSNVEFG